MVLGDDLRMKLALLLFLAAPALAVDHPCLILKRMTSGEQTVSGFGSWGIRLKQFQYVSGDFPDGKFKALLNGKDVENIMKKGGKAVFVESKYSATDLEDARKQCSMTAAAK